MELLNASILLKTLAQLLAEKCSDKLVTNDFYMFRVLPCLLFHTPQISGDDIPMSHISIPTDLLGLFSDMDWSGVSLFPLLTLVFPKPFHSRT